MEEKLRECFDEMVVYKDLKKNAFFSSLKLPAFLRDWLLKKFEDDEGYFDVEEIAEFVRTYIPKKEEWISIKNRIVLEGEKIKFLTKIAIDIDIRTQAVTFSIPDFGLTNSETIIEPKIWNVFKDELVKSRETWGVVELGYLPPDESGLINKKTTPGKIKLVSFTNFCPYTVDLEYYKEVREEFTVDEWIDVVLGAIDYNADGYESKEQKLTMLSRLLPFVEKSLNLIELAPKGTGKSYVFGAISRYGCLSAGKMTRAKLFYDLGRGTDGLVFNHDFIAFDEVQKLEFDDPNEMSRMLQNYMEQGMVMVGNKNDVASAGFVLLGNIDQEKMDEYQRMFDDLPILFKTTAFMDRLHGFIKGWDIPRMNNDMKVSGWALNSEYFCTIMHLLRDDASYRAIVDKITEEPPRADTRDTDAIKKIATALLKLLFPNVRSPKKVDLQDFQDYCLRPATQMRRIVKRQQGMLDTEYHGKEVPIITIKDVCDES